MDVRSTLGAALTAARSGGGRGIPQVLLGLIEASVDDRRLRAAIQNKQSSISDSGTYPEFCRLASEDDLVFGRFRRSLIYTRILEHVSRHQGELYLEKIENRNPQLLDALRPLLDADTIGGPLRSHYPGHGLLSPSTLRYIKVASDLEHLFGSLDGMRVAEIGVGYGGQCRVLSSLWDVESYDLFDIPEVLALSRRFLAASGVDSTRINEIDGRDPRAGEYDLVISNYAFSELRREVQQTYLSRVIQNARGGFMIYNHISPSEFDSLSARELADSLPDARILEESPLTFEGNVVVVWGARGSGG